MTKQTDQFIADQTKDPIVQRNTCRISWEEFAIYKSDREFYNKISPTFAGQKFAIPLPTLSPKERKKRRFMFRNERKLYKRKCDATGKSIVSIYSPDKSFKVYDQAYRRSDSRDPMDYGIDVDFSKTFNEQFNSLYITVPRLAVLATQNENSLYVNGAAYNKNCYLIFASDYNEDTLYADNTSHCQDVIDSSNSKKCTNSYQLIGCTNCSNTQYSIDCHDSYNLISCFDCKNCQFCFGSSWLRNKQYYFQNQAYTKEQYESLLQEHLQNNTPWYLSSRHDAIYRASYGLNNEKSYGNYINNCKDSVNIYSATELENCKHIINAEQCNNCQDSYVIIENSTLCYENVSSIWLHHCCFTFGCWNKNSDLYYCDHCQWCKDCFGCVWLRNKQYCIFNKQYTRDQYETLVAKLITHMTQTEERGEYFDPKYAPFGYNETIAQDEFPLTQQEAISLWYKRQTNNYDPEIPAWAQTLTRDQIPTQTKDVSDNILDKIIICEISHRPFRITQQELQFYKKHNIAIPRKHPDVRHEQRNTLKPYRELFLRNCDKCSTQILSVYPEAHTGKVYCDDCYQKEMG